MARGAQGAHLKAEQEKLKLEREMQILRQQVEHLKRKADETPAALNSRVYADRLVSDFNAPMKADFILSNQDKLKAIFVFTSSKARLLKRSLYETAVRQAIDKFERWTADSSGNRWLVKSFNLIERDRKTHLKNPEDFLELCFIHKGFVRPQLGDATLTPEPVDITMKVRVYRYEIE